MAMPYWMAKTSLNTSSLGEGLEAKASQGRPAKANHVRRCAGEHGAQMLRDAGASRVIALEYDESAAAHAGLAYPMVRTVRANLDALPLPDRSIDMLVTMQVVEHLWDLPRFLRECRRVLRPGGLIAAATPNRPTFSPGLGRGERPANPFHVEEFDAEQVAQMLAGAAARLSHACGRTRMTIIRCLCLYVGERRVASQILGGQLIGRHACVSTSIGPAENQVNLN